MFGSKERVEEIAPTEGDTGYEIRSREPQAPGRVTSAEDMAPEGFVEKVKTEGGDVYYVPFLEALRSALKRRS